MGCQAVCRFWPSPFSHLGEGTRTPASAVPSTFAQCCAAVVGISLYVWSVVGLEAAGMSEPRNSTLTSQFIEALRSTFSEVTIAASSEE